VKTGKLHESKVRTNTHNLVIVLDSVNIQFLILYFNFQCVFKTSVSVSTGYMLMYGRVP
jgi:hypothetical protein